MEGESPVLMIVHGLRQVFRELFLYTLNYERIANRVTGVNYCKLNKVNHFLKKFIGKITRIMAITFLITILFICRAIYH